jgi:TPR repeat protein
VTLDYTEAAKWVQKAAEQGYARAQIDLAYLYEQGKGVRLNYVSAYTWYKLGGAGDERGRAKMKSLSHLMTRHQISEATVRATEFLAHRSPREGIRNSNEIGSALGEWR